ncbi:MAG: hypothetical protein LAO51_19760 [Acidobacteriia bacterium]|nr:hypothetical protein [Terriglobia bacterium]
MSGRATSLAVNPQNEQDVWLGTAGGGVWHTTDGGVTWTPMSDNEASLAIGAISVAGCQSNGCSFVYAGTGENAIRRDTYYGKGLLVGTVGDGGVRWTLRNGQPAFDFSYGSINNVVLDRSTGPGATQVLYITFSSGVTASASESTVTYPTGNPTVYFPGIPARAYGIYKSTDNGASWNLLTVAGAAGAKPTDLEIDRTNSNVLYAGFNGRGIFKSTQGGTPGGGGPSWCPMNSGIPRPLGCPSSTGLPNPATEPFDHVEIDIDRSNPLHLYALFGLCSDQLLADCQPAVYESTDGGVTWFNRYSGNTSPFHGDDAPPCPGGYSRYTHGLTVHPTDPATLFLTGNHLCKSIDHGISWADADANVVSDPMVLRKGTHLDHHEVVFHETDTSRAYEVNDGGITVSTDGGTTWRPRNDDLPTIEFQTIDISPRTARVIGGSQDNGGMMWTGSRAWSPLPCCGDAGFTVMSLYNELKMYETTNTGPASTSIVVPIRSTDGGNSFNTDTNTYNIGLPDTDPRSFYPPLVQLPITGTLLYFGTNLLYRSNDEANTWTPVSPVLSSDPEPEVNGGVDVISAIAVSASNPNRIYIGYYSGKVFVTSAPCTSASCWPLRAHGLPGAPISWIAVDPNVPDTAYATVSGFGWGSHVYVTTDGGLDWNRTGSLAELNGVPANTIAIEPDDTNRLWLGNDKGVYKSLTGGGSWFRYSQGLPNVPVYSITIDKYRKRIFAATHGRGAYVLTGPEVATYGGCANNALSGLEVFGDGFPATTTCSMKIVRQDGSICASGSTDVFGIPIWADSSGSLGTSLLGPILGNVFLDFRPGILAWEGSVSCNQPGNPASTVAVTCGSPTGIDSILGCPATASPPSAWLGLPSQAGGFFSQNLASSPSADLGAGDAFDLLPAVQSRDGSSRTLCGVTVPFQGTDSASVVLGHARDAVNASSACQASGVSAELLPASLGAIEDRFAHDANLHLAAPGVTGGELVPVVSSAPGQATGVCFSLDKLGVPVHDQINAMRIRFTTSTPGPAGGSVVVTEISHLGECTITVPTTAADTPASIASALAAAFQASGDPGPNPNCPASNNPRDVKSSGDSVGMLLASQITVCTNDAGVGLTVSPQEICFVDSDCNDGNPCTTKTCNLSTGQCQATNVPDGSPCEDHNACTVGTSCVAGVCGTPVNCNDGNACTTDVCDPATGGCSHLAVVCDDSNPCTTDSCNPDTGKCLFSPTVGVACSDGNPCTSGEVCVMDPASGAVRCQGTPKCDDGNPCTADYCDPMTGQCQNQPIQCDDGDPCTFDLCQGGVCTSSVIAGSTCDDGDRCTTGDSCVPGPFEPPVCQGQPVNCDDANACTVDACDPVTGGCLHTPVVIAEVPGLHFTSNTVMTWTAVPGATFYDTYRGTIPAHGLGSRPPPDPLYDQTCFEFGDSLGDGALVSTDPAISPVGTAFYYLVSEVAACGEGPIGSDSNGSTTPNSSPCPLP